jgi:trigger factor
MLKVEVETLSPIRRRLKVEVPREQVVEEMERAYSGLSRQARIPGFRPGRAPRHVLERQFGDHVRSEVFGKLIQQSLTQAVEREEIAVVGAPHIETEQAQPGHPLRYSATLEVYPAITVGGHDALELERPVQEVGDADVDRALEELRQSLAQLRPVEGRATVERGDVAVIDYEGRIDGRTVTRGEQRPCEIGEGRFPPGFEDHLIGAEVGTGRDFDVVMPAEGVAEEVAGKTVSFHVEVRSLSAKEVPVLDDEFAKDHGECDTLDQLRQRVRSQLEAAAQRHADERVRAAAVAKLVDAQGEIELPQALVDERLEQLMHEVVGEWRQRRIWPKDEAAAFASLREELAPRAEGNVRAAVVLDTLARQEGIEVTPSEVEDEIERVAGGAGDAADRVRSLYSSAEARQSLAARLRRQRTVEWAVGRARIRDVPLPSTSVIAGEGESR